MSSSSFCLSSATILRCVPLSRLQSVTSLIPTVLEVIATTFLIVVLWNSSHRRHLLLTAESWMFFALSVLELLTHVLDAAQTNIDIFAALDVTIGVASFLPLFFYCFFLYIYTDSELLPNAVSLPKKVGKVGSLLLLLLIPGIVGVNEVASFIGIERRMSPGAPAEVLIGFSSQKSLALNVFFSTLSLVFVALFQAIVFLISGFRLVVAILDQRRYENLGQDAVHLVKGIGWISAGMKIGAIETVIGFAGGGFGVVITRRIFRFLGRACLCIGVVKGIDEIEDFRAVRRELSVSKKPLRNPKALLISNPRLSTFQQLTPNAHAFYSLPRVFNEPTFKYNNGDVNFPTLSPKTPEEHLRSLQEFAGITTFESLGDRKKRVTIQYPESGGAPTLELRLSMAGFPSPSLRGESRISKSLADSPTTPQDRHRDSGYAVSRGRSAWDERGDNLYRPEGLRPKPILFDLENQSRGSATQSITESTVEIVIAPQRTLSQNSARARLYRAPSQAWPTDSDFYPTLLSQGNESPPARDEAPQTFSKEKDERPFPPGLGPGGESDVSLPPKFRVDSFQSLPDTLQAVRELAREFPGPPLTYNGRPLVGGLQMKAWDDEQKLLTTPSFFSKSSRESAMHSVYAHPAELRFPDHAVKKGRPKVEDEEKGIEKYASRPVIMPPSTTSKRTRPPGSKPRIFISAAIPPEDQQTGKTSPAPPRNEPAKAKPSKPSNIITATLLNRAIDPFNDSQSPDTPTQEIINRPTGLRPPARINKNAAPHKVSVPSTPETAETPLSWCNLTPPINTVPSLIQQPAKGKGSNRWKYDSSVLPSPPERAFAAGEGLPRTPVRFSDARSSRYSFPLGSAASWERGPRALQFPPKTLWLDQEDEDEEDEEGLQQLQHPKRRTSAEEEHRRQQSMDAAAHTLSTSIPWLKSPEIEEEERKLQKAMSSSALVTSQPKISRIKTVGSVASRKPTLKHTVGPMRRSLRAEPIVVTPPPNSYKEMVVVAT